MTGAATTAGVTRRLAALRAAEGPAPTRNVFAPRTALRHAIERLDPDTRRHDLEVR